MSNFNLIIEETRYIVEVEADSQVVVRDTVAQTHTKNEDTYLAYGGANQVSAADVLDAVNKKDIDVTFEYDVNNDIMPRV